MAETNGTNGSAAPGTKGAAYPIQDHTYDVLVVGAGGAACVRSLAAPRRACAPPASPRSSPPAPIPWPPRAGVAASLGNMGDDKWEWHMYTP